MVRAMNGVFVAMALASAGGDGWDGGWWLARLAVTVAVIVLVVFSLRWFVFGRGRWGPPSGVERARGILAERYARGEIDANEYQERLNRLR